MQTFSINASTTPKTADTKWSLWAKILIRLCQLTGNSAYLPTLVDSRRQLLVKVLQTLGGNLAPPVNLIPDGSLYLGNSFDLFQLLTINTSYTIIFGANDTQLTNLNGTPAIMNAPGTFQFTTGPNHQIGVWVLQGVGLSVTATIYQI